MLYQEIQKFLKTEVGQFVLNDMFSGTSVPDQGLYDQAIDWRSKQDPEKMHKLSVEMFGKDWNTFFICRMLNPDVGGRVETSNRRLLMFHVGAVLLEDLDDFVKSSSKGMQDVLEMDNKTYGLHLKSIKVSNPWVSDHQYQFEATDWQTGAKGIYTNVGVAQCIDIHFEPYSAGRFYNYCSESILLC